MFNSDPVAFARIEDGNVTRLDIGRRHGEADVTAIQPAEVDRSLQVGDRRCKVVEAAEGQARPDGLDMAGRAKEASLEHAEPIHRMPHASSQDEGRDVGKRTLEPVIPQRVEPQLGRAACDQCAIQSTDRTAGDPAHRQTVIQQRLVRAALIGTKGDTAGQNERNRLRSIHAREPRLLLRTGRDGAPE